MLRVDAYNKYTCHMKIICLVRPTCTLFFGCDTFTSNKPKFNKSQHALHHYHDDDDEDDNNNNNDNNHDWWWINTTKQIKLHTNTQTTKFYDFLLPPPTFGWSGSISGPMSFLCVTTWREPTQQSIVSFCTCHPSSFFDCLIVDFLVGLSFVFRFCFGLMKLGGAAMWQGVACWCWFDLVSAVDFAFLAAIDESGHEHLQFGAPELSSFNWRSVPPVRREVPSSTVSTSCNI